MSAFSEDDLYRATEPVRRRMPPALWRHRLLLLMAVAWSIALGPSPLFAQNIQHTENKPDLALRSDTRVDPSTLGMSFSIPLASYPGRAGHGLPVAITYNSKVLRLAFRGVDSTPVTGAKTWTGVEFAEHSTAGWTSTLSPPRVEFTGMGQFYDWQGRAACADVCVPGQSTVGNHYIKRIHVHMPDGSSHELRLDDQTHVFPVEPFTGTFQSVDGSRMRFESNAGAASVLYLPDGSRYLFGPYNLGNELTATHFIDRSGNTLAYNAITRQWTDTLNRVITNPLPANPAANTETYFLAKLVGGTDATYTLRWKYLADVLTPDPTTGLPPPLRYPGDYKCAPNSYQNVSPSLFTSNFDSRVCVEQDQSGNPLLFNPVVLAEIVLPTGKFYRFTYTVYGEIDKILLTTGATDRFSYNQVATLSSSTVPYSQNNRGVIERRVSATGSGTDESLWAYAIVSTNPYTVRTTRPDLSYSERLLHRSRYTGVGESFAHFEFDDARMGMVYEERVYTSSGLMLRRELSKWVEGGPSSGGYSDAARDPKVIKQVSILLDGAGSSNAWTATNVNRYEQANQPLNLTSTTEYGYDNSMSKTTAQTASVDSFNPADSLAIRTTETAYLDNADYSARNLVSLPISVTIKTGMPVSGQVKARSEMLYDEALFAPLTCGATVGWTDPGATVPRANVTTVKSWLNTLGAVTNPSTYLATHKQYDQCGSVRKIWDARDTTLSNPTQIEYSHQFSYPTLNTSADPDGVGPLLPLTTSTEYDVSTGLVTATVDANGQRTTFSYNDPLNRLKQVVRAATDTVAKNQSTYSYDDSARTITLTSDLNTYEDNLLKTVTKYDGLGRMKETQTFEGGTNYIASQQQYDTLGRVFKTSNPFRPWQGETPVWTTTGYDELSRVHTVTTPDNAVVTTDYSGNTVTVTDQAQKKRKSVTDALGRLIEVYEDPNGLNYQTTYNYDVLDNLTTVTQGTQTRTFVYDSLKRLRSATNPESGTITYEYDNNSNLKSKTDARGVVTENIYDALNRVKTILYRINGQPDPNTGDVEYLYDNAANGANGKGRLWRTYEWDAKPSQTAVGAYDALGRVTQFYNLFGDGQGGWLPPYEINRTYNLAGAVKTQRYASGNIVTYNYDSAGRLADKDSENLAFTGNLGGGAERTYSRGISYVPSGALKQEQFGTNTPVYNKRFYNSRQQLAEILASATGDDASWNRGKIINGYSLQCSGANCNATDNNGNLRKQEVYIPANDQVSSSTSWYQQYDYDELNRLKRVQEYTPALNWQQEYVYDRWGNRTIHQTNTFGTGIPKPNFGVNTSNNRLTAPAGYAMAYDPAGNLTTDTYTGAGNRVYDAENRLTQALGGNNQWQYYTYNANGQRVRRKINNQETWQIYGIDGELLAEYAANGAVASPQKEYGYRNGQLLVTAEPGGGSTAANVQWKNVVNLNILGNSLTKPTNGNVAWDAGAVSTEVIVAGDGYMEFTASETNTNRMAGLSNGDSNQSYADIDFAIYLYSDGNAYVFEGGVNKGGFGSYAAGDTFRVAVESGVVKYRKNGTLLYTSTATPTYPLLVDTAISIPGGTLNNVKLSGTLVENVQWTSAVNVTVSGNSLTKPLNGNVAWDAGAVSTEAIASGDGYMEFTASESNTNRMAGLSNGDSNQNYTDIDFAIYLYSDGNAYVFEGGVNKGGFGSYSSGDTFRVAVESGVVKYRKNGALLYTSTITPIYPLLVDTAISIPGGTLNNVKLSRTLAGGASAKINWLITDHLGTPRMVIDQTGSLANVKRHDYLPFGEELVAQQGLRSASSGYSGGDGVRQQFTQKERDVETGLDYFMARYYSSIQGRFTSADPLYLELRRLGDPQQLNLYTYTRNNPFKFIDATGLDITVTGTAQDDYITRLQQNVSFNVQLNSQTHKVEIVDSEGNTIDNKALKAIGKTVKGKEKELFNAITDTKNHVTIETVQSDPDVDFGRSDGGGKNTIDFADIDLLDAPKNAGGVTSAHVVGHETLEAYASSKGKNLNDAHKFANKYFGGFGETTIVQRYFGPGGLLGVTIELPVQGTNIRELVTRRFVTPIPRNTLVTERIPGHIVDVEKKP